MHEFYSKVEECRDDDTVGHCEGVAKEAPLQCVALIPFSPNPFAMTCTFKQLANELLSPPENNYNFENELVEEKEEESSHIDSDQSG